MGVNPAYALAPTAHSRFRLASSERGLTVVKEWMIIPARALKRHTGDDVNEFPHGALENTRFCYFPVGVCFKNCSILCMRIIQRNAG